MKYEILNQEQIKIGNISGICYKVKFIVEDLDTGLEVITKTDTRMYLVDKNQSVDKILSDALQAFLFGIKKIYNIKDADNKDKNE